MAYALEIVALECLKNQEFDGDEIVIQFNDRTIFHWEDTGFRWAAELKLDDWTNFYNFRTNKLRTSAGEVDVPAYADFGFLVRNLTEPTTITLLESDEGSVFRGGDDVLGRFTVTEENASDQLLSYDFTNEGAHYRMTFAVVRETAG